MKTIVLIISLFVSNVTFGQLNSYGDSKNEMRMIFDGVFVTSNEGVLIISGKEDFDFIMFKDQTKLEPMRRNALQEVG